MRKLIIDSDGVSDDVRAVSLALQAPEVKVLALTAVAGCVTVGQACANLARTLRANRKRVPIYKGAEMPLVGNGHTHLDEIHFFGSDGLGNAPNDFPKVLPQDFDAYEKGKHAAVALCELFDQHPGTILVCIGPLTNVALALKLNPEFAKFPAQIVVLGGNVYGMGNVRSYSTAEFNFSNDPEAAHIVLKEMQCPVTIVPWETFMKESEQSAVDFHAHLTLDYPLAKFFATAVRIGRSKLEKNNRQYAYCDEIAVGVAIDPEGVIKNSKMLRASVELHGEMTRGQMAIDWFSQVYQVDDGGNPRICKKRAPIQFVMDYNVHRLDQMITEAIHNSGKKEMMERHDGHLEEDAGDDLLEDEE